jgi:DNA-binding transcriptional LysR family regulator
VLFDVVLSEGHVGRAAERMHVTASAVSHGLGRLRTLLNDPLFLKTPKGVVPTARALELAEPIADLLERVRSVVATAEPFEPSRSTRRFTIGAPDGVSAVFLPTLLARVQREAPGVDIAIRQLLPTAGETEPERAWRGAFADLESRAMDIAVLPIDEIPPRFHRHTLYEEDFVLAMRSGHRLARSLTLDRYCEAEHLVVSMEGDAQGFVDQRLAARGRSRRIALTVPNFMFALAMLAETELVAALPRGFASQHAPRFGLKVIDPPFEFGRFSLRAVLPQVALMDAGLAWLFALLVHAQPVPPKRPTAPRR